MIDLISAVRTLMRSASLLFFAFWKAGTDDPAVPLIVINTLVILYEVVWG